MNDTMIKKFWKFIIKPLIKLLPEQRYKNTRRQILNMVSFFGFTNSKNKMDNKIIALFEGKRKGTFIEIGAADGLDQSNTLILERKFGWTGLLVEPVKEQYEYCRKVRKKSKVERYVLTSHEDASQTKEVFNTELGSQVNDIPMTSNLDASKREEYIEKNKPSVETVPACTLDYLLKKHGLTEVDIFSLDVEGFEEHILNGFSLNVCKIKYLLVEAQNPQNFEKYAAKRNWQFIEAWSSGDFLYKICD